ncbi:hypothetical protein GDI0974 [Gluconacetobacter diazotrophicus PA1 5]|uniref:Uncharacterized protein n=1 Tax=Gluconacetobacter diazotrophicus (strain ATCC 49037 / DSM 5601 / CCUG 37298 / CIP 103539 / LMG 7603 / PAl5) TaxID=272568 RepID=A9HC96_GLUDA|nr:hypothetical protein GDI0974 [Gluconacetobacter diazotrophicus PA1 5]
MLFSSVMVSPFENEGGQFLISAGGQFLTSPDTRTVRNPQLPVRRSVATRCYSLALVNTPAAAAQTVTDISHDNLISRLSRAKKCNVACNHLTPHTRRIQTNRQMPPSYRSY